jgi:endonuclease-3 related protein
MTDLDLISLLDLLRKEHGPENNWWPAGSPFEVMVGAILTQQTTWETASKVLDEMRDRGLLDPNALAICDDALLERIVRPAGFFRQKTMSLCSMAKHVRDRHDADVTRFLAGDIETVRSELLALPGIGNETADSILLFAGHRPKFIAAAYVSRVLGRVGIFGSNDYGTVQRFVECHLPRDESLYREIYALFVNLCKSTCMSRPSCFDCILRSHCDHALRTR